MPVDERVVRHDSVMRVSRQFGFFDVWLECFLIVESAISDDNGVMRNDPEPSPRRRTWLAMLTSRRSCFSCGFSLNTTSASADGFCRDCLERARDASGDHLGGEA